MNKSSCLSPDNLCDVIVIDGSKECLYPESQAPINPLFAFSDHLLLTPLRHTVTPPPMSTHTLTLPSPALLVTHAPPPYSNDFLVKMTNGEIMIFSYNNTKATEKLTLQPPRIVGTTRLNI